MLILIILIYSTQRDLPLEREHGGKIIYLEKDFCVCGSKWRFIISFGGSPEILSGHSLKKQWRKSPSPNAGVLYIKISLTGRKFAAFPFFIFFLQKNTCERIVKHKQIMQWQSNLSKIEEAGHISPDWLNIFTSCVCPFHPYLDAVLPYHWKL